MEETAEPTAQAVKGQMTVPEHSPELSDTRAVARPAPAPLHDNCARLGLGSMFQPRFSVYRLPLPKLMYLGFAMDV